MNDKIHIPNIIKTKAGYTVDQLIVKLQNVSRQGKGGTTVCIAQPPKEKDMPPRLMIAGEGLLGIAQDGRDVLVIMPNLNEGFINPFGGNNGNKN